MDTQSPTRRQKKFGKRVILAFGLTGVILAGIYGLIFRSITELVSSGDWVGHSYQVLDTLDLTEAFFNEAQASERGYVATCLPSLITPFRHDLPQIYAKLSALRNLVEDNPAQLQRVAQLSATMTGELERMSAIITTTAKGSQVLAEAELTDRQNVEATQKISGLLNTMESEERKLLASRQHEMKVSGLATLISGGIGVAAIAGILGFVFWLIRREGGRREVTEAALQQNKGELESSLHDLQRYNNSARAISLLGELLQTCRSVDEALGIAARHLRDLMPESAGTIALYNNSRDSIEVMQRLGDEKYLGDALCSPVFRADDCWALRRGRAHLAAPGGFEPRCAHLEGSGFFLCIPMIAQGDTLGVLTMMRATSFADVERQTLQTITEQLSLSLANLRLQESLRHQSLRDPLTGQYNRRYMDEALPREVSRAQRQGTPIAIAMLDIDHFKRFNDTYGHEGGDLLLAAFGQLLTEHARGDDIVCRYGGEEFAVILPGADSEIAVQRLDEIRLAVRGLRVQARGGQPLGTVTMSAGVAVFPRDGTTGAAVMATADAMLYAAKRSGRDKVISSSQALEVADAG
jgi:diguanylate cyclase (GGDEF)-like protein